MNTGFVEQESHGWVLDKVLFFFIFTSISVSVCLLSVNQLFFHYPMNNYMLPGWPLILPYTLLILAIGYYIKPHAEFLFFGLYLFLIELVIAFCSQLLLNAAQTTSFPLIDPYLLAFDEALGFSTGTLLNWSAAHPLFFNAFLFSYAFVVIEIFLVPVMLVCFKDYRRIQIYFILLLGSNILGIVIYYCFPSIGPFFLIQNSHYLAIFSKITQQYIEIHQHIQPSVNCAGMVSCPSLHILWILIITYGLWPYRWLLIPLSVFNIIAALATVCLGYHYLADVVASIILFLGIGLPLIFLLHDRSRSSFRHIETFAKPSKARDDF